MAKPRPTQFEVRKSKPYHGRAWRVTGYVDGKRKALWYATERQARAEAAWRNREIAAYGTRVILDATLRLDAARARDLLAGTELSILDAVRLALNHRDLVIRSKPFAAFASEYRAEIGSRLAQGSLRPRAAESLRETLRRMERYFGETNVAEITPEALTAWISEMPSPSAARNAIAATGTRSSKPPGRKATSPRTR